MSDTPLRQATNGMLAPVKAAAIGMGMLIVASAASAGASPTRIEIFTTDRYPIDVPADMTDRTAVSVYRLDALRNLEDRLSEGLPSDPAAAQAMAIRRIQRIRADKDALAAAARAQAGLALAAKYPIEKLPAIVFDGQAVIYGMTDMHAALDRYRKWLERAK